MKELRDRIFTLTVIVPSGQAPTDDDAIDLIGERLGDLYWTGSLHRAVRTTAPDLTIRTGTELTPEQITELRKAVSDATARDTGVRTHRTPIDDYQDISDEIRELTGED